MMRTILNTKKPKRKELQTSQHWLTNFMTMHHAWTGHWS